MREPRRPKADERNGPADAQRYRYPAKDAVRAHLLPFWCSRSNAAIERATVWCLPGADPVELAGYLDAGMRSAQMCAFEWTHAVAKRIAAWATREQRPIALWRGPLHAFLDDPTYADARCDWANLDFDGSALSFAADVAGVIARMQTDLAPRLAITSFASRDHTALRDAIRAASALHAIAPTPVHLGFDLAAIGNERMGLVMRDERVSWFPIAREFAVIHLLVRALGSRSYGAGDARDAAAFQTTYGPAFASFAAHIEPAVALAAAGKRALPREEHAALRRAVADRAIPLVLDDWLRFAFRSQNGKWMWTWMFRFAPSPRPVPLTEWIRKLCAQAPPLHVVDRTGRTVRGGDAGICSWCLHGR